jgi:hypothetical protein
MSAVPDLIFPASTGAGHPVPKRLKGDPASFLELADAASSALRLRGWASTSGAHPDQMGGRPAGSGVTVMQMDVVGTDEADQWGGCRAIGSDRQSDQSEGKSGWASMAVYLPTNFIRPDQWMLIWQNLDRRQPGAGDRVQGQDRLGRDRFSEEPAPLVTVRPRVLRPRTGALAGGIFPLVSISR